MKLSLARYFSAKMLTSSSSPNYYYSPYVFLAIEQLYLLNQIPSADYKVVVANGCESTRHLENYIAKSWFDNLKRKTGVSKVICNVSCCTKPAETSYHCIMHDYADHRAKKIYIVAMCKSHTMEQGAIITLKPTSVLCQITSRHIRSVGDTKYYEDFERSYCHSHSYEQLLAEKLDLSSGRGGYTCDELKDRCKEYGLSYSGNKEQLASNIRAFYELLL